MNTFHHTAQGSKTFWAIGDHRISLKGIDEDFYLQKKISTSRRAAPSEILVSREFSRFFFNFHFSFSISSHLSFTFNSRKRVKGIYFSLFTSRKKWKLSEFHSFFSRKKSEIRCGVWPDISLSSQIVFFLNPPLFVLLHFLNILMVPSETNSLL